METEDTHTSSAGQAVPFGLPAPVIWHVRRVAKQVDRRFFLALPAGPVVVVSLAAVAITLVEKDLSVEAFGVSFSWGITTVLG